MTTPRELAQEDLQALFDALGPRGWTVVGPTERDGAVVLAELTSAAELPYGVGVALAPGGYRLRGRSDQAAFAHSAGPQSWKTFLRPERARLWQADRDEEGTVTFTPENQQSAPPPRYALLGVHPCDLAGIARQDRVLLGGAFRDPVYAPRREAAFVIAVACSDPGELCFCASVGTGPGLREDAPCDLAVHELGAPDGSVRLLLSAHSERGAELLADPRLPLREPAPELPEQARRQTESAESRMGRQLESGGLREVLAGTIDSPIWEEVASRCLTCGNCTLVCPTCFCTTTEDTTDLPGDHAERWRRWDSCFDLDFSYVHGGGPVRASASSRYRQWLTHKLGTWHDQFGSSGCVGCGRRIVWCPVGIDLTVEAARLREEAGASEEATP